jgi:hypothetical protein
MPSQMRQLLSLPPIRTSSIAVPNSVEILYFRWKTIHISRYLRLDRLHFTSGSLKQFRLTAEFREDWWKGWSLNGDEMSIHL